MYYCAETERLYTREDLEELRQIAIADGDELSTDTLERFIYCALAENNGTLIEVKEVSRVSCKGKVVFLESNLKTDLF